MEIIVRNRFFYNWNKALYSSSDTDSSSETDSSSDTEPETHEEETPEFTPAIYAFGNVSKDNTEIEINWHSNITGDYVIYESDNNEDYESVAIVSDEESYTYPINDSFDKKYFKVSVNSLEQSAVSMPFIVKRTSSGYISELLDTDEDKLADLYEQMLGTDINDTDTDDDTLTDYEEVYITGTDPLVYDSDTAGISDADADSDEDRLSNRQEITLGTNPQKADTDGDTLSDGNEVNVYHTDPLVPDTDGDGLDDGDEVLFGENPNNEDSNGNGTPDGEEKRTQTFTHEVENKDCAVTEVTVTMDASGNINNTTEIESIMNKDYMCSRVVGLVGEPFSIETTSDFTEATLTYKVDQTKLGDTEFDNLMFLWYDEENDNFVELETEHDADASTVCITTTHFSKYLIVDRLVWNANWTRIAQELQKYGLIGELLPEPKYNLILGYGWEVSKDTADPISFGEDGNISCKRLDILNDLYSAKLPNQKCKFLEMGPHWASVSYDTPIDNAYEIGFGYEYLKNGKISITIDEYNQYWEEDYFDLGCAISLGADAVFYDSNKPTIIIYIITDDYYTDTFKYMDLANTKHKMYFLDLRDGIDDPYGRYLEWIADFTGGEYLKYSEENVQHLKSIYTRTLSSVTENDSDNDRLNDMVEKYGLIYDSTGNKVNTDYQSADSDNDGLDDNVEVDLSLITQNGCDGIIKYYHHFHSDPNNADTDHDYYPDGDDMFPHQWEETLIHDSYIDDSNSASGSNHSIDVNLHSNGILHRVIMGDGGTQYKNEYVFRRFNNTEYSRSPHFELSPKKKSFYAITVTNVNSIKDAKIHIKSEQDSFWSDDDTIYAEPYEKSYNEDDHTATYIYLLEPNEDDTYHIRIHYRNEDCNSYEVKISQANWVYAPNGGRQTYKTSQVEVDNIYVKLAVITDEDNFESIKVNAVNYSQIIIPNTDIQIDIISLEGMIVMWIPELSTFGNFLTVAGFLTTPFYSLATDKKQQDLFKAIDATGGYVCFSNLADEWICVDTYYPIEWTTPGYIGRFAGDSKFGMIASVENELDFEVIKELIDQEVSK